MGSAEQLEDQVARLEAENVALRASDEEWRRLLDNMPQIVWITRPDGWHTHFNRQWLEFTGLTLEESLGHGWNPPFHPEDRARATVRWNEATRTGEPYEIEYRLRRADGAYHWMLGRAVPLRGPDGAITKWFGTCTDIEELKQAQARIDAQARQLEQRATTDSLTGVGNRALLFDRLEFLLAQRHRSGLAVAFIDMDGFKEINDALGHEVGDRLLVEVGLRLRSATLSGDVVARLGGDEFVVLTEAPTEDASRALAETLADVMHDVHVEGVIPHVSASIGVTFVSPHDSADPATVVARADRAMYRQKRAAWNGRQRAGDRPAQLVGARRSTAERVPSA